LIEITKLEERINMLSVLRKTSDPEMNSNKAYRQLLYSDFGKVVVIDVIGKYIKLLSMLEKEEDNGSKFYELKGQLTMVDWLLTTIKENLVEDTKEEV
jgi:hypothetical protein